MEGAAAGLPCKPDFLLVDGNRLPKASVCGLLLLLLLLLVYPALLVNCSCLPKASGRAAFLAVLRSVAGKPDGGRQLLPKTRTCLLLLLMVGGSCTVMTCPMEATSCGNPTLFAAAAAAAQVYRPASEPLFACTPALLGRHLTRSARPGCSMFITAACATPLHLDSDAPV